ncbi:hypothetical protein EOD39_4932 [Acipenser ruthenus]|uniref:Uncharacterized protein n=1 Tax=Acipenser ruthenus TaxID=7906 RepID=A0A444UGC1_ACIRT|nr:hypothetical protein EOD39_4932 [Acipenser ruthenus]
MTAQEAIHNWVIPCNILSNFEEKECWWTIEAEEEPDVEAVANVKIGSWTVGVGTADMADTAVADAGEGQTAGSRCHFTAGNALCAAVLVWTDGSEGAVFLREFTLIRSDTLQEESLSEILANHKSEDLLIPNPENGPCGQLS